MLSEEKRLGDVAEIIAGTVGFADKGQYGYQVVLPNSFSDTGDMNDVAFQYRDDKLPGKFLLTSGDILVKRLNPSFVYVVDRGVTQMVPSQNLLVVRPYNMIDPWYLGYLLEQKEIIGQVEHMTGSSAAIKAITVKKLAEIGIPVIPIAEQRKVGEIWKLSRIRKRLLSEYIKETDRLVSMLASKIINGGGNTR